MRKLLVFLVLFSLLSLVACGTTNNNGNESGYQEDLRNEEVAGAENGKNNSNSGPTDSVASNDTVTDMVDGDTPVSSDGNENEVPPVPALKDTGSKDGQVSPAKEDIKYITERGTYVGLMDPHSIEIMTEEGPVALQILDIKSVNFEEMAKNLSVTFQYYKTPEGQNILTSITEIQ